MKSLLVVLLMVIAKVAVGQDEKDQTPSALFKVVPQNFVDNTLKIGTEFFNKSRSKSVSIFVYGRFDSDPNSGPFYYGENRYKGLGGEAQYRKYISPLQPYVTRRNKNYLRGIYVAGYIQGASYSNEGNYISSHYDRNTGQYTSTVVNVHESIGNWGTGFTIGVHRTLWNVLFIDAYVGGGIQWSDVIRTVSPPVNPNYSGYYYTGITSPGYQGIMPKFGIQLGIPL